MGPLGATVRPPSFENIIYKDIDIFYVFLVLLIGAEPKRESESVMASCSDEIILDLFTQIAAELGISVMELPYPLPNVQAWFFNGDTEPRTDLIDVHKHAKETENTCIRGAVRLALKQRKVAVCMDPRSGELERAHALVISFAMRTKGADVYLLPRHIERVASPEQWSNARVEYDLLVNSAAILLRSSQIEVALGRVLSSLQLVPSADGARAVFEYLATQLPRPSSVAATILGTQRYREREQSKEGVVQIWERSICWTYG